MEQSTMTILRKIFVNSVTKLKPKSLISKNVQYDQCHLSIFGDKYDLKNKNVYVVGAGKAVLQMATEVENLLGSKISGGVVSVPWGITKNYPISSKSKIECIQGAENNIADEKSMIGAQKIKHLVKKLTADDLLLVLLSGGGSALLPDPIQPIKLQEKSDLIKSLSLQGADIKELNVVRKRLSGLKGGKLAMLAHRAQVVTLLISDIVGICADMVASGPTFENNDNPDDALKIVEKYLNIDKIPLSILNVLKSELKPNEKSWENMDVSNYVLGNNVQLIEDACEEADKLGFVPFHVSHIVAGNVDDVAKEYSQLILIICKLLTKSIDGVEAEHLLKSLSNVPVRSEIIESLSNVTMDKKGICLIAGGEPVVKVMGNGKGGRNQHLVLKLANEIKMKTPENPILDKFKINFLSGGTDGIDGPTDAAGAIGYSHLIDDALKQGLNVENYLQNHDSYNFFSSFSNGDYHIKIGHTNTNVMDLHVIVIEFK